MSSPGSLRLSLGTTSPPFVLAQRDERVSDVFWGKLCVEWGYAGNPARAVQVPLPRFLMNLTWLRPACRQFAVTPEIEPAVLDAIRVATDERKQLDTLLAAPAALLADEVHARLAGTRFVRHLREFQVRDAGRLLALPHGANFSVPGAGKTTVAYAVYEAERVASRVDRLLVVAPLSAFDAWRNEVGECFAPDSRPGVNVFDNDRIPAPAEVLLINYHRLTNYYDQVSSWASSHRTMVLLDEAHRMKAGRTGTHGNACLDLAFAATRRDILTGTPAPQAASDLVSLMDFLWPGQARRILPSAALTARPSAGALHSVADAIKPLFVRTRKAELGLTAPILRVESVPLQGLHRDIYLALRARFAASLQFTMADKSELGRMGAIVMYLLEAATNPQLLATGSSDEDPPIFRHPPLPVEPGSRLWDLIQRYHQYETPPKFAALARILKSNAECGRKTLVWSNFVRNIHTMERMFARYQPAVIYGQVASESSRPTALRTREGELARFRNDPSCMVLIANPAAMSEGVSLHQECHDAVYLDRTFNAGQYLQSIDRIHRLGLPPDIDTRLTFLVTGGTVDDIVDERIAVKAKALSEMLDDPDLTAMALPGEDEGEYASVLEDTEDLRALFEHLRGEPR